MTHFPLASAACLLFALASLPAAAQGLIFSAGTSGDGDAGLRVAYEADWPDDTLDIWGFSGHWDAGLTAWQIEEDQDILFTLSASPFLRRDLTPRIYLDVGVGVAAFSEKRFGMRDLGSFVTFENRIGFGLRLAEGHDLQLQARHYSNGGLAQPNDGVELYTVGYRFNF